jgi:cyanophycinase
MRSCLVIVAGLVLASTTLISSVRADNNILGLPQDAFSNQGSLVICGGGRTPDAACDEFVRLAGGSKARLVLIPSAYPYDSMDRIQRRFSSWRKYRVASFDFLDAHSREEANSAKFLRPLEQATGVWIPGGYQARLTALYGGTKAEKLIRQVLERGGVVGGTSAGAAVMSEVMIRYGTSSEAVISRGFGLLSQAVVDQHFSQRGRHARLLDVIEDRPETIGLGIDEQTALVVCGNHLHVLGNSRVTVYIPTAHQTNIVYRLKAGEEAELVPRDKSAKDIRANVNLVRKSS